MKPLLHTFLVVILTVFLSGCDKQPAGYIVLSNMFGDNMVLQRQKPVVVWGKASPNKKINIELAGNMASAVASADSLWEATLPALEAGGPYDLKISGKDTVIVFENILIGDVWLCSGQSNMVWKIDWKTQPPLDTIEADNTQIRLFTVPNQYALQETWNIPESSWNVCNPKTARDFSAVAYYFGQKINKTQNVPIGLVCSAWGGTIAQTWISSDKIVDIDKYKEAIEKRDKLNLDSLRSEKQKSKDQILAKVAKTDGIISGKAVWAETDFDDSSWETMSLPGLWERRGLEGLDGVVWFRKAINIDKADLGKDAVLNLAKIDDSDKTWVNGALVGETNAYNFERNYKIKNNILKEGKNVIAVRVKDDSLGGGIYGDTNLVNLTIGNKFIPLQGEWKYMVSPEAINVSIELLGPNDYPSLLFNGMVNPLLKMSPKGVLWYQGEANTNEAAEYRKLFPMLINNWRDKFNDRSLPFFFVQLPNYGEPQSDPGKSTWAELREAQAMALSLPNTGMAVAIDIGEAEDIHPKNKIEVGNRLALIARNKVYGEKDVVFSGPVYKKHEISGDSVRIHFDHIGARLKIQGDELKGFEFAGPDSVFVKAKATIADDKVYMVSKGMEPRWIRYGWANNPECNLYNSFGLPAAPFRTDDF